MRATNEQMKKALMESIDYPSFKLVGLSEAATGDRLNYVMDSMFSKVASKFNLIDFSTIEKSKGNIEKFKYVRNIEASIDRIKFISKSRGNTDVLKYAVAMETILSGLRSEKAGFSELYANPLVKMIYNSSLLNLIRTSNILLNDFYGGFFSKTPETNKFKTLKPGAYLTLKNTLELSDAFKSDIPKLLNETKKSSLKKMNESLDFDNDEIIGVMNESLSIFAGAAIFLVAIRIVPIIREIIYGFYHLRISIDNMIEVQNELIKINIESLEAHKEMEDAKTKKKTDKIISKQEKIIAKLTKIQDFVKIKTDIADTATKNQIRVEDEEIKSTLSSMKSAPSSGSAAML